MQRGGFQSQAHDRPHVRVVLCLRLRHTSSASAGEQLLHVWLSPGCVCVVRPLLPLVNRFSAHHCPLLALMPHTLSSSWVSTVVC
ncbi:hypothetical protein RJT34_05878 [Clitoria ternatea]|uniref:Uncharacterized protein n=1 Tax=Clitoria ternatea TaxID=43366 RepID=A0AAN9PT91_CLITE